MPPLTDEQLIFKFKRMSPSDQIVESRLSPRHPPLVQVANHGKKSLVIITQIFVGSTKEMFESMYNSKRCMQAIEGSVPYARYQLNSSFSKCNTLLLWKAYEDGRDSPSAIAHQIVSLFPDVTDLKFAAPSSSEDCELLIELLQHPSWATQLTTLMLVKEYATEEYAAPLAIRVSAALNGLSALQLLSVKGFVNLDFSTLTLLAQVKDIAVHFEGSYSLPESSFLRSFNDIVNESQQQQQVHLIWDCPWEITEEAVTDLLSLSERARSRIVGISRLHCTPGDHHMVFTLLAELTSLVSAAITIAVVPETPIVPLFTALAQFRQLLYLELFVGFSDQGQLPPPLPPLQLSSVRALDLCLHISSHDQVAWLNLAATLPNCQVIHVTDYFCSECSVNLCCFTQGFADYRLPGEWMDGLPETGEGGGGAHRTIALNCFRTTFSELQRGVPAGRIIIENAPWPDFSLEQLLLPQ